MGGLAAPAAGRLVGRVIYGSQTLLDDCLPYFLFFGFSEAWLTGALITLFVV
jgi:hypothetical protein